MAFLEVAFPGGKKARASLKGFTVYTDQPADSGGEGAYPTPFDMFFVSLGTCTGVTALNFCQSRGIETEGLKLELDLIRDSQTNRVTDITMEVILPRNFPEKYKKAMERSVKQCTVSKHIFDPPNIETVVI